MKVGSDVNLRRIAEDTEPFTGAELEGLCKEAGIVAVREDISAAGVCERHFRIAKNSLNPTLTKGEIHRCSSFMKTSSSVSCGHSEWSSEEDMKKRSRLLPLSLVRVGIFSLVLLAAAK
ncbi:hypothetical protein L6164_026646 [Bauhinia variegata]|uniref:Uncharacterized protein n=1 Tax=Bauhinia variegata TaxID=167791 RepID=A0ACB9LRC7_BAUVA|nr:hypothetical protein L6164_026646 [Bauhinia variegata]